MICEDIPHVSTPKGTQGTFEAFMADRAAKRELRKLLEEDSREVAWAVEEMHWEDDDFLGEMIIDDESEDEDQRIDQ